MNEECQNPALIQLATSDDLKNIQHCARKAYTKYIERMGREPAPMNADFAKQITLGQIHIALYESNFSGYIVFYREGDHLHLENVAVIPSYEGKGIGKSLINFAEQTARQEDLSAVELYTNEAMTENLIMYPKLGYIEVDRKQQDGFNRVFYRKSV